MSRLEIDTENKSMRTNHEYLTLEECDITISMSEKDSLFCERFFCRYFHRTKRKQMCTHWIDKCHASNGRLFRFSSYFIFRNTWIIVCTIKNYLTIEIKSINTWSNTNFVYCSMNIEISFSFSYLLMSCKTCLMIFFATFGIRVRQQPLTGEISTHE